MKLIVGLGNPGKKYQHTRHNMGFMAVDQIAEQAGASFSEQKKCHSQVARIYHDGEAVLLLKPQTMMNRSGEAVAAAQRFFTIDASDTLIVYDDLALPFGTIRTRQEGESAGHNGIKSIIAHCGNTFYRLRLGIAGEDMPQRSSEKFVLSRFTKKEEEKLPEILEASTRYIEAFMRDELRADTHKIELD